MKRHYKYPEKTRFQVLRDRAEQTVLITIICLLFILTI